MFKYQCRTRNSCNIVVPCNPCKQCKFFRECPASSSRIPETGANIAIVSILIKHIFNFLSYL